MRKWYPTAVLLAALLAFGSLARQAAEPQAAAAVQTQSVCLLKAYNGKLARFDGSNPAGAPTEVYEIYLQNLPPYDQTQLETGLWFADEAALQQALADFES